MIIGIVLVLIGIGLLFSILRLVKGPTAFDRVMSVDTINVIVTGTIAVLALVFENGIYLDIALVYGILSFLETIIIARYLEVRA